jgi:deoxyribodipyrimidine photo-lyase
MLENGLFIFRRDLRIVDNKGLDYLSSICKNIYAIFIFTPEQVGSKNKYKSDNSVQFMIESLDDMSSQINKQGGKLYTFYGNNEKILSSCIDVWNINVVAFNLDITPYARLRDDAIVKLCQREKVFITYDHDYYLCNPGSILNGSGETYQKFTPFYENAKHKKVELPIKSKKYSFSNSSKLPPNHISLSQAMTRFTKINKQILVNGGRTNAIKQMRIASKNIRHYASTRDDLSKPTSQLSAYIKFGCVSIREVYNSFKTNRTFIRQLYWRDFYANIVYAFPHVIGHSMTAKYDKIRWHYSDHIFDAWSKGMTGFPLVDASQRQLIATGWTHNRGRMLSSSILTKIFLIDWKKGEQFYAQHLVDYDVANNNGGWQWSSGSGADSQPYFRYFNPYSQSKEHDPKCEYIKTWIPELKDIPNEDIHNWDTQWEHYKDCGYPKPIVDYVEQREKSIKMYKSIL